MTNIENIIIATAQSVGMPLHFLLAIPVGVALCFHILRSADGKRVCASTKDWNGNKGVTEKPSTIAMIASVVFILYSVFMLNNAVINQLPPEQLFGIMQ